MDAAELVEAIAVVVEYNWADEVRDFKEHTDDDDHMLKYLYRLARFAGMDHYVAEYEELVPDDEPKSTITVEDTMDYNDWKYRSASEEN